MMEVSPLVTWLKQFFKTDKKFGSKDSETNWTRLLLLLPAGKCFSKSDMKRKFLTALFLCSENSNKILEELKPEWNHIVSLPVFEKIKRLSAEIEIGKIFSFATGIQ